MYLVYYFCKKDMDKELNINLKVKKLLEAFGKDKSFSINDAEKVLGEKRSTLKWTLYNLVKKSYLMRKNRGEYIFSNKQNKLKPILSSLAEKIIIKVQESGLNFFISGLDIVGIYMHHIPESYPVILFTEKDSVESVIDILKESGINAVGENMINSYDMIRSLPSINEIVKIYSTKNFIDILDNKASYERAFVDLYYEVTRNKYPLPIQELARIFFNMKNRVLLNEKKMLYFARWRKIDKEINNILNYKTFNEDFLNFIKILNIQNDL
jgi:hypothetical protein